MTEPEGSRIETIKHIHWDHVCGLISTLQHQGQTEITKEVIGQLMSLPYVGNEEIYERGYQRLNCIIPTHNGVLAHNDDLHSTPASPYTENDVKEIMNFRKYLKGEMSDSEKKIFEGWSP